MSNDYQIVASSGTRTSSERFGDFVNWQGRGLVLATSVTDINGSLIVSIRGKDLQSSKYFTVLSSSAIIASGVTTLSVYPGIATSSNVSLNGVLPQNWDVTVTSSGTATYSIGASIIG